MGSVYRATAPDGVSSRWATREISALDFLTGIPLEAENSIVREGHRRRRGESDLSAREDSLNTIVGVGVNTHPGHSRHSSGGDSVRIGGTGEVPPPPRHPPRGGERERSERAIGFFATVGGAVFDDSVPHPRSRSMSGEAGAAVGVLSSTPTRWWEKILRGDPLDQAARNRAARRALEGAELERPSPADEEEGTEGDEAEAVNGGAPVVVGVSLNGGDKDLDSGLPRSAHTTSPTSRLPTTTPRAPGRRLEGRDDAIVVRIPRDVGTAEARTMHRTVARQAAVREWEIRVAHGIADRGDDGGGRMSVGAGAGKEPNKGLLDGRAFFSSCGSYPMGVFSVIKYDPKSEKAARMRKKLEERGEGGTKFVMPARDWRGISYRALIPRAEKKNKAFNRVLRHNHQRANKKKHQTSSESKKRSLGKKGVMVKDTSDYTSKTLANDDEGSDTSHTISDADSGSSTSSSDISDSYGPGFLDDPEMKTGRHRHVMVGDKVTGPLVSSTIQFVKPADLKADLNRQFKERFDGWEPSKGKRKYIGAQVIGGIYTLYDPTEDGKDGADEEKNDDGVVSPTGSTTSTEGRHRSRASDGVETIRMPPSLTLSKIRSAKQQALVACVKANVEISTVALACIYFERLCLDCRVDKSNRRLSFAACLLLSAKTNEANVAIVHDQGREQGEDNTGGEIEKDSGGWEKVQKRKPTAGVLRSWIRPTNKSRNITEALFEFFTHDWALSLKHLFAAEWVVFTALGFDLHATPYQVAFHFKRLMKVLEWNALPYLGQEMYGQWQECLDDDAARRHHHQTMKELRRKRKERKILALQHELHKRETYHQGEGHLSAKKSTGKSRRSSSSEALSHMASEGRIFGKSGPSQSLSHVQNKSTLNNSKEELMEAPIGLVPSMREQKNKEDLLHCNLASFSTLKEQTENITENQSLSFGGAAATAAFRGRGRVTRRESDSFAVATKRSVWNRFALAKMPSRSCVGGDNSNPNMPHSHYNHSILIESKNASTPTRKSMKRVRSSPSMDGWVKQQSIAIDMVGICDDEPIDEASQPDDMTV